MNLPDYLNQVAYIEAAPEDKNYPPRYMNFSKYDDSFLCYVDEQEKFTLHADLEITARLSSSIGFSPKHQKWYAWTEDTFYGFGIGTAYPEYKLQYWVAKTLDEAKAMALCFSKPKLKPTPKPKPFPNSTPFGNATLNEAHNATQMLEELTRQSHFNPIVAKVYDLAHKDFLMFDVAKFIMLSYELLKENQDLRKQLLNLINLCPNPPTMKLDKSDLSGISDFLTGSAKPDPKT